MRLTKQTLRQGLQRTAAAILAVLVVVIVSFFFENRQLSGELFGMSRRSRLHRQTNTHLRSNKTTRGRAPNIALSQRLNVHGVQQATIVRHAEHAVVNRQHRADAVAQPLALTSFHPGIRGLFHEAPNAEKLYLDAMLDYSDLNQFVGIENVCVASKLNPNWGVRQYDPDLNKYAFYRTSMMLTVQLQSQSILRDTKVYLAAISIYEQLRQKARSIAHTAYAQNVSHSAVQRLLHKTSTVAIQLHQAESAPGVSSWKSVEGASTVSANMGRCAFVPRALATGAHPVVHAIQEAMVDIYAMTHEVEAIGRHIAAALLLAELQPGSEHLSAPHSPEPVQRLAQALRYRSSGEEKAGGVYADLSFSGLGACFLPSLRPYLQFNLLWAMLFLVVHDSREPANELRKQTQLVGEARRLGAQPSGQAFSLCEVNGQASEVAGEMLGPTTSWHFLKSKRRQHKCNKYAMLIDYWGNAHTLQTAHELRNLALTLFWEYAPPGKSSMPGRQQLPPLSMLMHHGANMNAIHNNPGMPARYASWLTRGLMSTSPSFVEASLHRPFTSRKHKTQTPTVACFDKVVMRFKSQWDMPLPAAAVLAVVGKGILATKDHQAVKDERFSFRDREAAVNLVKVLPLVQRTGELYELLGKNTFQAIHKLIMRQIEMARHAGERNGPYTTNVSCTPRVVVLQRGEGSNLRAFSNLPAVLSALHEWLGYTPPVKYIKGSMSLYEQAAAVAGAELIITPHGSHNMGTMFGGKTGVAMLEVMPHPRDTAAHGYSAVHGGAQYFSVGHTPTELATPVSGALPGRSGRPWSNAVHMRAASREWHEACRVPAMQAYWGAQEDIRGVSFPLWRFCQHRTKVRFITESDTTVDTGVLLRDARKVMAWMTGGRCS